jgi:surface protein
MELATHKDDPLEERVVGSHSDDASSQSSIEIVFEDDVSVRSESSTSRPPDEGILLSPADHHMDTATQSIAVSSESSKMDDPSLSSIAALGESLLASKAVAVAPSPRHLPENGTPSDIILVPMTLPAAQTILQAKAALSLVRSHPRNALPNETTRRRDDIAPQRTAAAMYNPERHPLDDSNNQSEEVWAPPCITTAEIVTSNTDDDERACIIRETQLAIAAETTRAEIVALENGHNRADHVRSSGVPMVCSTYFWIVLLAIVAVGTMTTTSVVLGRGPQPRDASPNRLGASNATAPSTATRAKTPTSSPTAWTADGKRAFTSKSELWAAVDAYLAWRATGEDTELSKNVARYGFPIGTWDVSRVTDFTRVFDPDRQQTLERNRNPSKRSSFDEDLSGWDLSNAVTVRGMFAAANTFTGRGVETWVVDKVTDFSFMFALANKFVGNVSSWNTSRATSMEAMFLNNVELDADVTRWDVSNVKSTAFMFEGAESFVGGDLRKWNVARVQNMQSMFGRARAFTGIVSTWNTSRVTNMGAMVC